MNNELYDNIQKLLEPFKEKLNIIIIIIILGIILAFIIVNFRNFFKRLLSHIVSKLKKR